MALEGTLKDFSLADIFQLIGLQRKTGVLTLRAKDDTVTVTFLDGKVVGADSLSHRLENRLGHVLIRSELLTQDQLNRALEVQKETLQRLGFILVHYGIISIESLKQALQLQILQIVFRLFRWKDGDYHFSQETTIEYDRDYDVLAQKTPLDEDEVAETPVPLPLVAALALVAIISLATSFRNPINALRPLGDGQRASSVVETRKAISIERIEQIGEAVESYSVINGHLPARLQDLVPIYLSATLLKDPWGH